MPAPRKKITDLSVSRQTLPTSVDVTAIAQGGPCAYLACPTSMLCIQLALCTQIDTTFAQVIARVKDNLANSVSRIAQKFNDRYANYRHTTKTQKAFDTHQDAVERQQNDKARQCAMVESLNKFYTSRARVHLSQRAVNFWTSMKDTFVQGIAMSQVGSILGVHDYTPPTLLEKCNPTGILERQMHISDLQTCTRDTTWAATAMEEFLRARGQKLNMMALNEANHIIESWMQYSCIYTYLGYIENFSNFADVAAEIHGNTSMDLQLLKQLVELKPEIKAMLVEMGKYHGPDDNLPVDNAPPLNLDNVTVESYSAAEKTIRSNPEFQPFLQVATPSEVSCAAFILAAQPAGPALITLVVVTFMKKEGIPIAPHAISSEDSESPLQTFIRAYTDAEKMINSSVFWLYIQIGGLVLGCSGFGGLTGLAVSNLFYVALTKRSLENFGENIVSAVTTKFIASIAPDVIGHVLWFTSVQTLYTRICSANTKIETSHHLIQNQISRLEEKLARVKDWLFSASDNFEHYSKQGSRQFDENKIAIYNNNILYYNLIIEDIKSDIAKVRPLSNAFMAIISFTKNFIGDIREWIRRLLRFNDRQQIWEMCSMIKIIYGMVNGYSYYIRAEYNVVQVAFEVLFCQLPMSHIQPAINSLSILEAGAANAVCIMTELAAEFVALVHCYVQPDANEASPLASDLCKTIQAGAIACYVAYFYVSPAAITVVPPIYRFVEKRFNRMTTNCLNRIGFSDEVRDVQKYVGNNEPKWLKEHYLRFGYEYLAKFGSLPASILENLIPVNDSEKEILSGMNNGRLSSLLDSAYHGDISVSNFDLLKEKGVSSSPTVLFKLVDSASQNERTAPPVQLAWKRCDRDTLLYEDIFNTNPALSIEG